MTAAELHAMVSQWPAEYREVQGLWYSDTYKCWNVPDDHAAALLCHHAEGVLATKYRVTVQNKSDEWTVSVEKKGRGYWMIVLEVAADTRLAAIDAVIRAVEGGAA